MAILNFTTKIDVWQTVSEIQQILSKQGATHFAIRNEGSRPAAVSFAIDFKGQPLNFLLPCNYKGVYQIIKKDKATIQKLRMVNSMDKLEQHSYNVAWRIIKDWIEAQMALVQVEMVKIEEVFMPYLIINAQGDTLSKKILEGGGLKLLGN